MPTISDIIENFILGTMGNNDDVNLSRNELADYFKCAPSQINYVLTTRFNINRGYIIESQRGGGGYIKIERIKDFDNNYFYKVIENMPKELGYNDAKYILEDLVKKKFMTLEEAKIVSYAISPKALSNPVHLEGSIRSNIMKNTILKVLKEKKDE